MAQYYHACGRINYELWQRHMALPAFSQSGELHVDTQQSVAEADAARERYGLDAVIMQVVSELGLSEIAGVPPIDTAYQLRSIIAPRIHEGVSRTAQLLAGRFPISSKRFRSALLEAEKHDRAAYVFSFRLGDDEHLFDHDSIPCGSPLDGIAIPLIGSQAGRNAVEIPMERFFMIGAAYRREPLSSSIPALRITNFVDVYRHPSSTRFFSESG